MMCKLIEIPGSSEYEHMVEEWRIKAECLDVVIMRCEALINGMIILDPDTSTHAVKWLLSIARRNES